LAGGLFRFNDQTWYTFSLPPELNKKVVDPWYLTDFIVTSDNVVWVGARQDGLYRFEAGIWTHYTATEDWPYQGVDHLAIDTQNRLWAILHTGEARRLVRFDGQMWQAFDLDPVVDLAEATGLAISPSGEVWLSP